MREGVAYYAFRWAFKSSTGTSVLWSSESGASYSLGQHQEQASKPHQPAQSTVVKRCDRKVTIAHDPSSSAHHAQLSARSSTRSNRISLLPESGLHRML